MPCRWSATLGPSFRTASPPHGQHEAHADMLTADAPAGGTCTGSLRANTPVSLADMPQAWLQGLPAALGSRVLHLVLSARNVVLAFRLPTMTDLEFQAAKARLLLACKYACKGVHVAFHARTCDLTNHVAVSASAGRLMTSAMAAAGQPLTSITSVELPWAMTLVPSWLTATCPNATRLSVSGSLNNRLPVSTSTTSPTVPVQPAPSTTIPTIPVCSQLQELHLTLTLTKQQPAAGPSSSPPTDTASLQRWQHQLQALTSLHSLTLGGGGSGQPEFVQCCAGAVGVQLTRLGFSPPAAVPPGSVVRWFPCLRDLQLPCVVDDEGMEALLSLQALRKLQCTGFQLRHSYSNRPCAWTQLGFTELDVVSFDRLTLGPGMQITAARASTIYPSQDLAANQRVASVVVRGGGIQSMDVILDNSRALAGPMCLEALMPMLSACRAQEFTLSHAMLVTPELLAAMRQHLSSPQGLWCITFTCCVFGPDMWPLLLRSLPPSQVVHLRCPTGAGVSEAQVTWMCVHACRPVEVMVTSPHALWLVGWQQRVQAAMARFGYQPVKLHQLVC